MKRYSNSDCVNQGVFVFRQTKNGLRKKFKSYNLTSYIGLFASAVGWSAKKALASAGLFCNLTGQ